MSIITRITSRGVIQEFQEGEPASLKIEVVATDESGSIISGGGGGGTPGGADSNIQYNDGGSFAGTNNFTFDGSAVHLSGSLIHGSGSLIASGLRSHVEGWGNTDSYGASQASGDYSHAEGESTNASGIASHAEGQNTTASGNHSHAEGFLTNASGIYCHAEGSNTTANGYASHAEGAGTSATANFTHAEGNSTLASQEYAHAEGVQTIASGYGSHSEGDNTIASGDRSHAEGGGSQSYGNYSHAEGHVASAGSLGYVSSNISSGIIILEATYGDRTGEITSGTQIILDDSGTGQDKTYLSTVFAVDSTNYDGTNTTITLQDLSVTTTSATIGIVGSISPTAADTKFGQYSHAEGEDTIASGYASHAEGIQSVAAGVASHAEGYETLATGNYSHAEGYATLAAGNYSHAEGGSGLSGQLKAAGIYSHAEGYNSEALGEGSHAEGIATIASGSYQHVSGKYNKRGNDFSIFVIGNGIGDSDVNRSDIFRVNQASVEVSGSFTLSGSFNAPVGGDFPFGTADLNGGNPGTVSVTNSLANSNSVIFLTKQTLNHPSGFVSVSAKSGGSFTITSNYNGDTDTVAYFIVNPA